MAELRYVVAYWDAGASRCHWQLWLTRDGRGGDARVEREDTFPLVGGELLSTSHVVQAVQHAVFESLREQVTTVKVPSFKSIAVVEVPHG